MRYDKFVDVVGIIAEELSFLAGAVCNDEIRPFMNYIHIEQEDDGAMVGVATDGRRLHVVNPFPDGIASFGITPGFWRVLKKGKRVWAARLEDGEISNLDFPNWRKVVPVGKAKFETTFTGLTTKTKHNSYGELVRFFRELPDLTIVNFDYLFSLNGGLCWTAEWNESVKPMKLTSGNLTAVIMPMRN
jgi:hypothetical protein